MVCLPCIVLPLALWIYVKFLQPFLLRVVPERWRARFDAILYPTCPIKAPPPPADEKERPAEMHNGVLADGSDKKLD